MITWPGMRAGWAGVGAGIGSLRGVPATAGGGEGGNTGGDAATVGGETGAGLGSGTVVIRVVEGMGVAAVLGAVETLPVAAGDTVRGGAAGGAATSRGADVPPWPVVPALPVVCACPTLAGADGGEAAGVGVGCDSAVACSPASEAGIVVSTDAGAGENAAGVCSAIIAGSVRSKRSLKANQAPTTSARTATGMTREAGVERIRLSNRCGGER